MGDSRTWTTVELHDLIQVEVSTGRTMHVLNASISGGELNAAVRLIAATAFAGFSEQATQIEQSQAAIKSIVADTRAFVAQTHTKMQASKTTMSAEVDALNVKLQDVVKFIESNNTKAAEVEESLKVMTTWCRENHLESIPVRVTAADARSTEIVSSLKQRFRELSGEISVTRSAVGNSFGTGGQSAPHAERDRNVFDVRDYKLSDLGAELTTARANYCQVEEMAS